MLVAAGLPHDGPSRPRNAREDHRCRRGPGNAWPSQEPARHAARLTGLAILGSLDRIGAWVRVFGMVNSAPGFVQQPSVINGFTELILDVFGPTVGARARSAVGLAELPFGIPVEVEAELELRDRRAAG